MTAGLQVISGGYDAPWEEVLAALTREEFDGNPYIPEPDNAALYGKPCACPSCDAPGRRWGLCNGHYHRCKMLGADPDTYASLDEPLNGGRRKAEPCTIRGCQRSTVSNTMCASHSNELWRTGLSIEEYRRVARPVLNARAIGASGTCLHPDCSFIQVPRVRSDARHLGLCDSHNNAYRQQTRMLGGDAPSVEDWIATREVRHRPKFWFESSRGERVHPTLELELRYLLQLRTDEHRATLPADVFNRLVNMLVALEVRSLLDFENKSLRKIKANNKTYASELGFVAYGIDRLSSLRDANDGRREYDRDVWRLRVLGFEGHRIENHPHIDFTPIADGWLRQSAKRWAKMRLQGGTAPATVFSNVRAIKTFCRWAAEEELDLSQPVLLTRDVLEEYAGWMRHESGFKKTFLASLTSGLRLFLDACRWNDWVPDLPSNARWQHGEVVFRGDNLPRFLEEDVLQSLEAAAATIKRPDLRLMVGILISGGLRNGDMRRLAVDCVYVLGDQTYLRPKNWKKSREFAIPISQDLYEAIVEQQQRVRARFGDDYGMWLFPRPKTNPTGDQPYSYGALKQDLAAWTASLDLRDARGMKVDVTAHRLRHSCATRLLNSGMSLAAVAAYLDHDDIGTTVVYAKVLAKTLRDEWTEAEKQIRVNARGDLLPPYEDEVQQAARWLRGEMPPPRASQMVTNGWCVLHPSQQCPHANACYSGCGNFESGPVFLGGLIKDRERAEKLAEQAKHDNRPRQHEINSATAHNLTVIIDGICAAVEQLGSDEGEADADHL